MKRKVLACGIVFMFVALAACGSTENSTYNTQESDVQESEDVQVEEEKDTEESVESSTEIATEQAEEISKYAESVYAFVDGETIKLDINYPEGHYLDVNSGSTFHRLYTPYGHELLISSADEEEKAAYDNYVTSGAWSGTKDWAVETLISEQTVKVPIGTVTVITGEDENGRVTDHCFIEYANVLWYITREQLFYSDTATAIENIISEIFNEKEPVEIEPVVEIPETKIEVSAEQYEYCLTDNVFDREAKTNNFQPVFGFNFANTDFSLFSVNEWESDANTYINSYEFHTADFDSFKVEKTDAVNIAFLKEYLLYGTYTENAHIGGEGATILKEMELREVIDTPYGPAQIVCSIWCSMWDNVVDEAKEFVLLNVNGTEVLISYEEHSDEILSLDTYEGNLKNILTEIF